MANFLAGNVSVINIATNTVIATITVGLGNDDVAVAFTPNGSRAYVTSEAAFTVSVIDTSTNAIVAIITVGNTPEDLAITPDGTRVYVANDGSRSVSVINTSTNAVIATVTVGVAPDGVAITPDGTRAYVVNNFIGNVSVIDIATNTVIATVTVGFDAQDVTITTTPVSVSGFTTENEFLTQIDLYNQIFWTNPFPNTTCFRIYRDAALTDLAGVVPANGRNQFQDHNRQQGQTYTYFVVAVSPQCTLNILGGVILTVGDVEEE